MHFGTRGSALALWQTRHVISLIRSAAPNLSVDYEVFQSRGDRILDTPLPLIGGKGVFTAELEEALRDGRIDGAVHSLKDLPTESPAGLMIAAIPARANPADALVSRQGYCLATLPPGARVGTSSHRRSAQLLGARPDLKIANIRGNVDSRIRKALDPAGQYDAIILALAGLERLGQEAVISEVLELDLMLPAPGQGAIAIQTRSDPMLARLFSGVADVATTLGVAGERAFLAGLGGGCSLPIAAHAEWADDRLTIRGRVISPDGARKIDLSASGLAHDEATASEIGWGLAQAALEQGAADLMGLWQ